MLAWDWISSWKVQGPGAARCEIGEATYSYLYVRKICNTYINKHSRLDQLHKGLFKEMRYKVVTKIHWTTIRSFDWEGLAAYTIMKNFQVSWIQSDSREYVFYLYKGEMALQIRKEFWKNLLLLITVKHFFRPVARAEESERL